MTLLTSALRLGLRQMFRRPGESATAIVVLALGIGLAATGWAVVWGTYLRPVPVPDSDRLVRVAVVDPEASDGLATLGYEALVALRDDLEQLHSLERLEAWIAFGFDVSGLPGPSVRARGASVTPGVLTLTGAQPLQGRLIDEDDVRTDAAVVVVSEEFWREHLDAAPVASGEVTMAFSGRLHTVIGVLPAGLQFPYRQDLWVPERETYLNLSWLQVLARLRPGSDRAIAAEELGAVLSHLPGAEHTTRQVALQSLRDTYHDHQMRSGVIAAAGAAIGILLLACANVANLLLARGLRRSREMAVRTSLGARRGQLMAQLLVEASVLAVAGGLLGLLLCRIGIQLWSVQTADFGKPFWVAVRLDPHVLWMIVGFVVASSLAAGLLPAWRQSQAASLHGMAGGHETQRAGADRWLVVAQVAGSVAILATCAVLVRTVERLEADREHLRQPDVLTARLSLWDESRDPEASTYALWTAVFEQLESLPEVESVAIGSELPEDGNGWEGRAATNGGEPIDITYDIASPGLFQTLGAHVVAGREFGATDRSGGEVVALIDEDLARALFPGIPAGAVIGRKLQFGQAGPGFDEFPQRTIVGVVSDLGPSNGSALKTRSGVPQAFLPVAQTRATSGRIVLKMAGTSPGTASRLAQAVEAAAPGHPLQDLSPLEHLLERDLTAQASARTAFAVLAVIALVLAAVGLYGVLAVGVGRQRRELAVRTALGATPGDLLRRVLGHGLGMVVAGCVAGLVLAYGSTKAVQSLLYGAPSWDPTALSIAVAVLVAAGFVASWIPARRAAKVQPASALREE